MNFLQVIFFPSWQRRLDIISDSLDMDEKWKIPHALHLTGLPVTQTTNIFKNG